MTGRRGVRKAGDQLRPDGLDGLVEEGAQIAAAFLERVEQRDAGGSVAADEIVDEGLDHLGVGEAEEVADVRFIDPVRRRRQQLVEHRLGVTHPARR